MADNSRPVAEPLQKGAQAAQAVRGAVKTGKAIAGAAKGAAAGGVWGAVAGFAWENRKFVGKVIIAATAVLMIPILILCMLPGIIFGGFGNSRSPAYPDTPIMNSSAVIDSNLTEISTAVSRVLSEALTDTLSAIDNDYAACTADGKEVINPYESSPNFNANQFVGQYCAAKNEDYGDWIVRELSCPAHLVISEEAYKVTVSEMDQTIEITVVNKFLTGKVQVRKVSSKDHDKLLSGAEFVLYLDVNGNKAYDPDIDTLYGELSEADTGVYEIGDLKHGGYLLLETKAPDGFTKDDRYFYFRIQKDGETVIVENEIGVGFTNEPIPTPTPEYPDSPKTGDDSKLWLWILLASGSLTVLITVGMASGKKRKAL